MDPLKRKPLVGPVTVSVPLSCSVVGEGEKKQELPFGGGTKGMCYRYHSGVEMIDLHGMLPSYNPVANITGEGGEAEAEAIEKGDSERGYVQKL